MAQKTLAVRYRPKTWDDVVEQDSIKIILQQQLKTGDIKNAYLFTGPAGDGKTTSARIFANDINEGQGNPIEMDAASNSGVEDVRRVGEQARTKSLDSEYKVFIIDEAHSISNTGWQAFLKLLEEPPLKSIFIFCTTNPEKIPKTILSRVQRYDFQKISQQGIVNRLKYICKQEKQTKVDDDALEYIARISEGGMRDAISIMEQCLSYDKHLTVETVVNALGTVDYDTMFDLTDFIIEGDSRGAMELVDTLYNSGKDIKQFVKQYMQFLLDVQKYSLKCEWHCLQIPRLKQYEDWLSYCNSFGPCLDLLSNIVKLNSNIRWSQSPKYDLECSLLLFVEGLE